MTRIRRSVQLTRALALALTLGATLAHAAPSDGAKGPSDPTDDNTRVRSLFRKAAAASQAGKYDEARQLLLDAWAIRQTYDVASSLAQVDIQLKRYRDAAEHLEFCIRNFAPVESEQTLEQAKKAFAEVRKRVAAVKLSTNRKGAEIFVDSVGIGSDPLPAIVFMEPGMHRLAARLGSDTAEQTSNVEAGKEYVAELIFSNDEAPAATPATAVVPAATEKPPNVEAPPPAAAPPQRSSAAPAIVAGSVAGIAVVTSLVLFLEANHKDSQRQAKLDQLPGSNRCGFQNPNANACRDIESLGNDARTFKALSLLSLGAAAAAGVTTYVLWPRTSAGTQAGFHVRVLPTSAGTDVLAGFVQTF